MKRPTGVTILAVLQLIGGLLAILGSLIVLVTGGVLALVAAGSDSGTDGIGTGIVAILIVIFAAIIFLLGVVSLILCYGLFTLKGWAWMATFVFSIIDVIMSLGSIIISGGSNAGFTVIGLAIRGVIIYYLMQPNVKRAFGQKPFDSLP